VWLSVWSEVQTCIMAQLMPLPPTVSCFSKIQIGFTFLVLARLGSPGQRAVKRVCVLRGCCNDDEKGVWRMAEFDPRPAPPLKPHIRTASEGVIMSDKAFCFCACASSRAVVFTRRFCRFYLLNALLARVIAMCPCLSV